MIRPLLVGWHANKHTLPIISQPPTSKTSIGNGKHRLWRVTRRIAVWIEGFSKGSSSLAVASCERMQQGWWLYQTGHRYQHSMTTSLLKKMTKQNMTPNPYRSCNPVFWVFRIILLHFLTTVCRHRYKGTTWPKSACYLSRGVQSWHSLMAQAP